MYTCLNSASFFDTKPYVKKVCFKPSQTNGETLKTKYVQYGTRFLTNCHCGTTQQTASIVAHRPKKHRHHDIPRPSASSGFKLIGECDRPTSHGGERSLQHGNATFYSEINSFFNLWRLVLCAADSWSHAVNRYVFYLSECVFLYR